MVFANKIFNKLNFQCLFFIFVFPAAFSNNLVHDTNFPSERLPPTTYPLRYHLHITTYIHSGNKTYSGNCTSEIFVKERTDELVLHAANLTIYKILINDLTTNSSIDNVEYSTHGDFLNIYSSNGEANDSGRLVFEEHHVLRVEILYEALIKETPIGFHKLSYVDEEDRSVFGALTHFEPIYARTALPCYDEPAFKSKFLVRITHGSNLTALSNMPEKERFKKSNSEMITTTFEETPIMSVYLLAFVISNFSNISLQTGDLLHRVFYPPNHDYTEYLELLTNSARTVELLTNMFDIPYKLPKLDHFFVEESTSAGMENWGLIMYNDSAFEDSEDAQMAQHHEIAHQWFGNLVTMDWWSHTWLNEGFASYYTYILNKKLSVNNYHFENFKTTCKETFHNTAVTQTIKKPTDFRDIFGNGVYKKAPCIIYMFENAFGVELFRKAISTYLKKHKYSSVNGNDLFDELQSAQIQHYKSISSSWNLNVHGIMRDWNEAISKPIISITRNYDENPDQVTIRQSSLNKTDDHLFWIPINFITSSTLDFENTTADYYMPPVAEVTIDLNDFNVELRPDDWLLVNKQNIGFYNVVYDLENFKRISNKTIYLSIHPDNRIAMFSNLPYYDLPGRLEVLKYVRYEDNLSVWEKIALYLEQFIDEYRYEPEIFKLLCKFLQLLYYPVYEKINDFPTTTLTAEQQDKINQFNFFGCVIEMKECLDNSRNKILDRISGKDKSTFYTDYWEVAAKVFTAVEFEKVLEFLEDKRAYGMFIYLAHTKDVVLYQKLVVKIFNIRKDDEDCERRMVGLFDFLTNTKKNYKNITWAMLAKNINQLRNFTKCYEYFITTIKNGVDETGKDRENFRLLIESSKTDKSEDITLNFVEEITENEILPEQSRTLEKDRILLIEAIEDINQKSQRL